jgi:hypothetical protein
LETGWIIDRSIQKDTNFHPENCRKWIQCRKPACFKTTIPNPVASTTTFYTGKHEKGTRQTLVNGDETAVLMTGSQ